MALVHILLGIDKNTYRELVRQWIIESNRIATDYKLEVRKGKLSEKDLDNFVCYEELVRKRDQYFKLWKANPKNLKHNMMHLILAVNTYVPPMRLTAKNMVVWKSHREPPSDDNNYIWEDRPGHWGMMINTDKIESGRREWAEKKGLEYKRDHFRLGEVLEGLPEGSGETLNKIITASLQAYPRKLLFIGVKNKEHLTDSVTLSYCIKCSNRKHSHRH
jgi:hypothetical protein